MPGSRVKQIEGFFDPPAIFPVLESLSVSSRVIQLIRNCPHIKIPTPSSFSSARRERGCCEGSRGILRSKLSPLSVLGGKRPLQGVASFALLFLPLPPTPTPPLLLLLILLCLCFRFFFFSAFFPLLFSSFFYFV